jgi:hypothetical protein
VASPKFVDNVLSTIRRTIGPMLSGGVGGAVVYSGFLVEDEKNSDLVGQQKYLTYSDLLANVSVIAASVRYYLNLISRAGWTYEPREEIEGAARGEAERYSDLVARALDDMTTPYHRVVRRASMYKFHGFSVQEWTARRMKDGTIGFLDVEARPQVTIERWDLDVSGTVHGVVQRSPQDGRELYLPRRKLVYAVDDALRDSPEGLGLFRHLAEPSKRLQEFQLLEAYGFETDLRGIPIARAPLAEINRLKKTNQLTAAQAAELTSPLETFIQKHVRRPDLGLLLDSKTYQTTDERSSPSSVRQWDLELLKGDVAGPLGPVAAAIERLNRELARVMGTEFLLLGGDGKGSLALSRNKTDQFALVVDSALRELGETVEADLIGPLFALNGWPEEYRPCAKPESTKFADVEQITGALADLAQSGATLLPDDPAINAVRDLLGVPQVEVLSLYAGLGGEGEGTAPETPGTGEEELPDTGEEEARGEEEA